MRTDTEIALSMSVADWGLIDATLDNITVVAIIDDPHLAGQVLCVRHHAKSQLPQPVEGALLTGRQITMRLLVSEWDVVLGVLDRAARTSAQIARDESLGLETRRVHYEIGADQVRLAALIRSALA